MCREGNDDQDKNDNKWNGMCCFRRDHPTGHGRIFAAGIFRMLDRSIYPNGAGPAQVRMGGTMTEGIPSKLAANKRGWAV
jgi:hypothetical protein